jgi:hypothetical protein
MASEGHGVGELGRGKKRVLVVKIRKICNLLLRLVHAPRSPSRSRQARRKEGPPGIQPTTRDFQNRKDKD